MKGAETEHRFFSALKQRVKDTPSWFLKIKRSSVHLDLLGVDAVARIFPKDDVTWTEVPLQIKSSEGGRDHYQQSMPELQAQTVIVIVVSNNMSEEDIRSVTYSQLQLVHESKVRYGFFYRELQKKKISRQRTEHIRQHIKKSRDLHPRTTSRNG